MRTATILNNLRDALRAARMKDASFGWTGHTVTEVTKSGAPVGKSGEDTTEFIKRKTELYMGSWVIPQLEYAIRELEDELQAQRKRSRPRRTILKD